MNKVFHAVKSVLADKPIDVIRLIGMSAEAQEASREPLQASVYLDDTAPAHLLAHVRSCFASSAAHARITISYLGSAHAVADPDDDIAIIVAGRDSLVGQLAQAIREMGVPVCVLAMDAHAVAKAAQDAGYAIPKGDLLAPRAVKGGADAAAGDFGPDSEAALDELLGEWVLSACKAKRLSFAAAFPFIRRPLALESVNSSAVLNAGIGALPLVPGADMPLITLNQAKMMLEIAAAYGEPINQERIKELVALVGNAYLCRNIARTLCGAIPVLGIAIKGGVGYVGTIAAGRTAIRYFENGGGVTGLGKTVGDAVSGIAKTTLAATNGGKEPEPKEQQPLSKRFTKAAAAMGTRGATAAAAVGRTAAPLAADAVRVGAQSFLQGIRHII